MNSLYRKENNKLKLFKSIMNNIKVFKNILNGSEITLIKDDCYIDICHKTFQKIDTDFILCLIYLKIIELDSGNWETHEQHFFFK